MPITGKNNSKKLQHILRLNKEEKLQFLESFDNILSDCDGVLWLMLGSIPKSGAAVNLLRSAGKKYHFISNNSLRTDQDYIQKLKDLGVENVNANEIVHPVKTVIRHLKKIKMNKPIYALAGDKFTNTLREAGFKVIRMENKIYNDLSDFANNLSVQEKVGAVVVDIDCNLTFAKLIKAQFYLEDPDCQLIVGASDNLMPLREDLIAMGPGRYIKMLSDVSGKKPVVLGKPGKLLGKYLIENYEISEPARTLFIGDALVQDIQFGNSNGFQTLLVLSGATSIEEAEQLNYEKKPDFYANSMADFIEFFKDLMAVM